MKQTKNISVLGCGWLGLALAEKLHQAGHYIKGSSTHESNLIAIGDKGIESFQIEFTPTLLGVAGNFFDADLLIVNIPPRRRTDVETFFPEIISNIIKEVRKNNQLKILFIGSTSVYPANNEKVNEHVKPKPEKASGKALLKSEQMLRTEFSDRLTILRFGGLVGYSRGPVSILRKKKPIRNPDSPLNLIHRDDCIAIIEKIIDMNFWGHEFNAVADKHPLRRTYYTHISSKYKLSQPMFVEQKKQFYKIVENDYLKNMLNYEFIYPDPMEIV